MNQQEIMNKLVKIQEKHDNNPYSNNLAQEKTNPTILKKCRRS